VRSQPVLPGGGQSAVKFYPNYSHNLLETLIKRTKLRTRLRGLIGSLEAIIYRFNLGLNWVSKQEISLGRPN
jgi:hypothetical protein